MLFVQKEQPRRNSIYNCDAIIGNYLCVVCISEKLTLLNITAGHEVTASQRRYYQKLLPVVSIPILQYVHWPLSLFPNPPPSLMPPHSHPPEVVSTPLRLAS